MGGLVKANVLVSGWIVIGQYGDLVNVNSRLPVRSIIFTNIVDMSANAQGYCLLLALRCIALRCMVVSPLSIRQWVSKSPGPPPPSPPRPPPESFCRQTVEDIVGHLHQKVAGTRWPWWWWENNRVPAGSSAFGSSLKSFKSLKSLKSFLAMLLNHIWTGLAKSN